MKINMLKLQIVLLFSMTVVQIFVSGNDCSNSIPTTSYGFSDSSPKQFETTKSEPKQFETTKSEPHKSEFKQPEPKINAMNSDASETEQNERTQGQYCPNKNNNQTVYYKKMRTINVTTNSPSVNNKLPHPVKQNDGSTNLATEGDHDSSSSNIAIQEMSGSIGGGMGGCNNCNSCKKCRKNVCDMPIVPEICRKQFTACNDTIHFQADVNLMFKERGFWCKLKKLVREAVEDGLDDRCELCRYNYVEKIVD